MSAGFIIESGSYIGSNVSGLYTTDSTSIFSVGSRCRVDATRGVSLLAYNWVFQQRNASNSSWITINSGSIGSSGSASIQRNRWAVNNGYRPRWRWYRPSGNGAATMRFRMYGYGRSGNLIKWSNNAVSAVGGSAPADNWKGNSGTSITWARRVNLADD